MSTRTDFANGKITTRSYELVISGGFSFDDFVTTVAIVFCTLPVGAVVTGGYVNVTTAWDITTSLLDIGDSTDIDEYSSTAIDLEVVAATALTLTGFQTTTALDDIQLIVTSTAPTVGEANLFLTYVDTTKADENFE